jgi:hypothetical protein
MLLAKNTLAQPKRTSAIPVEKQCTPTVQLEGQGSQGGLNPLGILGRRGPLWLGCIGDLGDFSYEISP